MKNLTPILNEIYKPKKAIVIFTAESDSLRPYVESYDIDELGLPINAHPLTQREADNLAKALRANDESETAHLQSKGIIPTEILQVRQSVAGGFALWTSPAQQVHLYFTKNLGIPDGQAHVPPMLWKATATTLRVWALATGRRPESKTKLYYAPFFNINGSSGVCMGTASIKSIKKSSLQEFTRTWEHAFWNTAFSHLNSSFSPTKSNVVQLWKGLIGTEKPFPINELKRNGKTLNDILS